MPWKVTKGGTNSKGEHTKYTVTNKETGKSYATNNPEELERLHEYYKNK